MATSRSICSAATAELDREIDRLITNIAKGADFDTYNPKVNELAAERKRVKAELAQIAAASATPRSISSRLPAKSLGCSVAR